MRARLYDPKEHEERLRLFDLVANKQNWKCHINATVVMADNEIPALGDAIIYFTGSVPIMTKLDGGRWLIRADGYYIAIGA